MPGVSPYLPLGCYRLVFSGATESTVFPGNAWRGAFGHQLRKLGCLTGAAQCKNCRVLDRCAYAYVFDTPVPPGAAKMRRYTQAPHPYVIREERSEPFLHLYLTLVGHGNAYLPLVILAITQAAMAPRGIAGRRLLLERVEQNTKPGGSSWVQIDATGGVVSALPPECIPIPELRAGSIQITLHSPLRVKRDGKYVREAGFRFSDLFSNLLRRISMLSYFHTDQPFEPDFRDLTEKAQLVQSVAGLQWHDQPRYSARQNANMNLGGVTGTLQIPAAGLEPFWPILWLGQFIHAGSAATMGLGHYTVTSLPGISETPVLL